jgi:hypothetical protein
MAERNVERFRTQAEECHQFAELATNPDYREAWLKLAGDWVKLAEMGSSDPSLDR